MAIIKRRKSYTAKIEIFEWVATRRNGAVDDQYGHGRRGLNSEAGGGAGSRRLRSSAVTVNNDAAAALCVRLWTNWQPWAYTYPLRRLPLQRASASEEFSGVRASAAKYRINPGNVSIGRKNDDNFRTMIECAIENDKPGTHRRDWGSLDQQLLARMMDENASLPSRGTARGDDRSDDMSALHSAELAESYGLPGDHILLSAKVSGVQIWWTFTGPGRTLRVSSASRPDRSRNGRQGNCGQHGRPCDFVAGRHRPTRSASL